MRGATRMPLFLILSSQTAKWYQNRKQGGYGAYMGNRKSVSTKKLIHLFSCCNPDLYRDTGIEQCNPKGFLLRLGNIISLFRNFYKCFNKIYVDFYNFRILFVVIFMFFSTFCNFDKFFKTLFS